MASNSSLRSYPFLELVDRALRIYRQNFLTFAGLVALVQIPAAAISYWLSNWELDKLTAAGFNPNARTSTIDPAAAQNLLNSMLQVIPIILLVSLVIALVQNVLVNGLLVYMASENHLGHPVSVGSAWSAVSKRFAPLAGGLILFYLMIIALSIGMAFILFACGLGFGVLVYIWFAFGAFLVPVLVLERGGISESFSRSWKLGKTRLWPLIGLSVGVWAITFIFSILQIIFATRTPSVTADLIDIVISTAITIITAPILPIGATLLYYDARVRSEGLDIAMRSAADPNVSPADLVPMQESQFMSNEDYLNLAIVIVGTIVLILIVVAIEFAIGGAAAGLGALR